MEAMSAPVTPDTTASGDTAAAGILREILDGPWHETREMVRENIDRAELLPDPSRTLDQARAQILDTMRSLAGNGFAAPGFAADHGGTGDVGAAVTGIETLGYADLSLMVKSG
ncbi:MAG: acyl-CoA oxidase, partial [Gordonia sp.]|nr:acyl-CoA oxidase [Gordonia sp. (in: high G+C Gram-positive bacteria)]